jgi:deazaflavin-dependent oxidoreductase (nitroreductase family)
MIRVNQVIDSRRNGMATEVASQKAPSFVERLNPIVQRMIGIGVPMGPNGLITIRGRISGELRTTPVAFVEIGGRTWVQSPFGDVNWVRNLRAAGEATITSGNLRSKVRAVELSKAEKVAFFRDVLGPYVERLRGGRFLAGILGLSDVLKDPSVAADRLPVFELRREAAAG